MCTGNTAARADGIATLNDNWLFVEGVRFVEDNPSRRVKCEIDS
jgi:hypothetical protein